MKVFARRQRSNTAMLTTSTAIFPSTLITGIPTIYSRHTLGCMGDALAAAPVQTLRTRETLGDCRFLLWVGRQLGRVFGRRPLTSSKWTRRISATLQA